MSVICNTYLSTRDFNYHADTKTLVAEISELSCFKGTMRRRVFGQVYDDACDEGFVLVSHRTGESITFVIDKVDMSGDDIAGWHLVPINRSSGMRDRNKDFTVLVIND